MKNIKLNFKIFFKDKWMNMGYEDDELKPYIEPQPDLNDQKRIGKTGTVQQQHFIKPRKFILFFLFYSFEIPKTWI
jgi:hypothetical protein